MRRMAMIGCLIACLVLLSIIQVHASDPLKLKLVKSAISQGAVCLDGTAPGYYFRAGSGTGDNKWIIYHQVGTCMHSMMMDDTLAMICMSYIIGWWMVL